jgi:hypothetical protein
MMSKRLVLILVVLALVATAGTVTKLATYQITLSKPTTVSGTVLAAGDYKLIVGDAKITIVPQHGGKAVEAAVKIDTAKIKFDNTVITSTDIKGTAVFAEIDLGGTKTKLLFAQ